MDVAFSGCPDGMRPYQTLGEIHILFDGFGKASERKSAKIGKLTLPDGVTNYVRSLDLNNAVCTVNFEYGGTRYQREYFSSHPKDCIVMHFTAEGEGNLSFSIRLRRGKCFDGVKKSCGGIVLYGNLGRGGSDFAMRLSCRTDGVVKLIGECLCVEGAKDAVLYFTAITDKYCSAAERDYRVNKYLAENSFVPEFMRNKCGYEKREYLTRCAILELLEEKLAAITDGAMNLAYSELKGEHICDYKSLYEKCSLKLCGPDLSGIPTDDRLEKFRASGNDNGLYNLMFDYGRYLTIACSRKGGLPATLQGLWNKDFFPAWDSKYKININTEMNYWHVEMCNLADCHQPLFSLIEKIRESGRITARKMYGCRGFVAHHNTDMYGDTAPQDTWYAGSYWVLGGAWLCTHLYEHYLYSKDINFLKEAFPVMAECALFFTDFLTECNGYLVLSPSVSPENSYVGVDGKPHCCCSGAAMDSQILRELFTDCIKAWNALNKTIPENTSIDGVDDIPALIDRITYCNSRLMPIKISSDGRIMEWDIEYDEAEAGHRHLSHMFALYPARQISPYKTPELAQAAEKTIDCRLSAGSGYTGWSRAWIVNLYAGLYNGEKTLDNLRLFLQESVYPNLFDRHPPFQIDGNFGICAAVCRMIVQSGEGEVFLLPALPAEWADGYIKGVRLVGNAVLSVQWKNGRLSCAEINASSPYEAVIYYMGKSKQISIGKGCTLELCESLFI